MHSLGAIMTDNTKLHVAERYNPDDYTSNRILLLAEELGQKIWSDCEELNEKGIHHMRVEWHLGLDPELFLEPLINEDGIISHTLWYVREYLYQYLTSINLSVSDINILLTDTHEDFSESYLEVSW
jgi:hypothetical protein